MFKKNVTHFYHKLAKNTKYYIVCKLLIEMVVISALSLLRSPKVLMLLSVNLA